MNNSVKVAAIIVLLLAGGAAIAWLSRPVENASPTTDVTPPSETTDASDQNKVAYLSPDEYYMSRGKFILDATGNTNLNTLLLPELPQAQIGEYRHQDGYVGPEICQKCHQEYFDGFIETAHYHTSSRATLETVKGSFAAGKNRLRTASPSLRFEMIEDDGQLFQRVVLSDSAEQIGATGDIQEKTSEFPFSIVTGSGKVGQTYLYWQSDFLYQLHASYLTSHDAWVNSPGYYDGTADFARPVLPLCLECHTTKIDSLPDTLQYDRDSMILGVTCEKCHGPAAEHVAFHQANPESSDTKGIINPANLPAERQMEVCQLCHGGMPEQIVQPPFSFRPGDRLDDFYEQNDTSVLAGIHSNSQLPRMRMSKCFTESESLTCIGCHNPHAHERGNMKLFSDRCLSCHQTPDCGEFERKGNSIADNCIDCHMPVKTMEDIVVRSGSQEFSPAMRDHFIRVLSTAPHDESAVQH